MLFLISRSLIFFQFWRLHIAISWEPSLSIRDAWCKWIHQKFGIVLSYFLTFAAEALNENFSVSRCQCEDIAEDSERFALYIVSTSFFHTRNSHFFVREMSQIKIVSNQQCRTILRKLTKCMKLVKWAPNEQSNSQSGQGFELCSKLHCDIH